MNILVLQLRRDVQKYTTELIQEADEMHEQTGIYPSPVHVY